MRKTGFDMNKYLCFSNCESKVSNSPIHNPTNYSNENLKRIDHIRIRSLEYYNFQCLDFSKNVLYRTTSMHTFKTYWQFRMDIFKIYIARCHMSSVHVGITMHLHQNLISAALVKCNRKLGFSTSLQNFFVVFPSYQFTILSIFPPCIWKDESSFNIHLFLHRNCQFHN